MFLNRKKPEGRSEVGSAFGLLDFHGSNAVGIHPSTIIMRRFRKKVSIAKQQKTDSEAEMCAFRG